MTAMRSRRSIASQPSYSEKVSVLKTEALAPMARERTPDTEVEIPSAEHFSRAEALRASARLVGGGTGGLMKALIEWMRRSVCSQSASTWPRGDTLQELISEASSSSEALGARRGGTSARRAVTSVSLKLGVRLKERLPVHTAAS